MKKILLIITVILTSVSATWAQITVGPSTGTYMDNLNGNDDNNGWAVYWKSSAKTNDNSTSLLIFNTSGSTGMNTNNGNIYSDTYTLTVPDGYVISGYTFNGTANGNVTITPNGCTSTNISNGQTLAEPLSVIVRANTTTFTISGGSITNLSLVVNISCVPVTVAYCPSYTTSGCSHSLPSAYGSFSGQTYTTNASSNMQGVTITASPGLSIGEEHVNVNYYGKCFKLVTAAAATDYTVTLQAPIDYVITGYRIGGSANTRDAKHTLTSADGSVVAEVTCPVDQNNQPKDFNVTGLNTNTTYFTINTQNSGNTLYLPIFQVYIAPASEVVNDTYNVIFNDNQVATKTIARIIGLTTSPSIPSTLQKELCTYSYYSDASCTTSLSNLTASGTTIYAKCTYPFTVSTSFATATWYNATLRGKYLRADDNNKDGSDRYATNSTNGHSRFYKWAFFGNPYDGIYIMNKGQGDGKYLYLNNQLGFKSDITPTKENNALFEISSNSNGGFTLRNIGGGATCYVNDNGGGNFTSGNLGLWNDSRGANDAGSKWVVTEDVSVVLSELSNNKSYKITCERGTLSTYTTGANTYLASPTKTELGISGKDFAILSYGDRYYLYSVDDEKFVTYSSSEIAPLADKVTGTSDAITFTETSSGSGVYSIRFDNNSGKNLNTWHGYEYGIVINNHTTLDGGNQYVIEEVNDFIPTEALGVISGYKDIVAQLKAINWSEEGQAGQVNRYNLTDNYVGQAGHENAWIESLEDFGYSESNLTTVQYLINHYALNLPTEGYYRIKGYGGTNSSGKYLASGMSNNKFSMTDATDATTIFYYDGTKLTNYKTGLYNGMNKNNWLWVEDAANASVVTFQDGLTNGGYAILSAQNANGTNGAYFYDNNSNADRGSDMTIAANTDDRYTHWYLEEVTSLPVIPAPGVTDVTKPVLLGNITLASDVTKYITASAKFVDLSQATIDTSIDDIKAAVNGTNPNAVIIAPEGTSVASTTTNVLLTTDTENTYTCNNLQLNDAVIEQFTTEATTFQNTNVTYTRASSASVWGTICLPYATSTQGDISYYRLVESSTSNLRFEKISDANTTAYEPYLIKKEAGAGLSVSAEGQEFNIGISGPQNGSSHNNYKLQGVLVNTSVIDGKNYTSAKDGYHVAIPDPNAYYFDAANNTFRKMNGRFNLKAFRAYLTATSANARENIGIDIFDNDQPTGISFVESEDGKTVDVIFDLNGRRLQNAKKGINIINGKKVIK